MKHVTSRRSLLKTIAVVLPVVAGLQIPAVASARDFPTRAVQIIVPYEPGAAVDTTARIVANKLSEVWQVPVIVENKPGAGTTIGSNYVAQAAPDGYTMLYTISDTFTVTPHLANYKSYQPFEDLAPVSLLANLINGIIVHPSMPFQTLPALIDYARANPGKLRYSSPGSGSNIHLTMEVLKSKARVEIEHIPYKGVGPATTAVRKGEVEIGLAGYSAKGLIDAGEVRLVVVAGPDRFAAYPKIPTTAEVGYAAVDSSTWLMLAAPKKTPKDRVEAINDAVMKVLNDPDVKNDLTGKRGLIVRGVGPAEADTILRKRFIDHGKAVHLSGADKE